MTDRERREKELLRWYRVRRPLLIPKHKPEPRRDEAVKYFEDKH